MSVCGNDSCDRLCTHTVFRRRDMIVKMLGWKNEEVSNHLFGKGACEQTSLLQSNFLQEGGGLGSIEHSTMYSLYSFIDHCIYLYKQCKMHF